MINHTADGSFSRPVFVIYDDLSSKAFKRFPGKFCCQVFTPNDELPNGGNTIVHIRNEMKVGRRQLDNCTKIFPHNAKQYMSLPAVVTVKLYR